MMKLKQRWSNYSSCLCVIFVPFSCNYWFFCFFLDFHHFEYLGDPYVVFPHLEIILLQYWQIYLQYSPQATTLMWIFYWHWQNNITLAFIVSSNKKFDYYRVFIPKTIFNNNFFSFVFIYSNLRDSTYFVFFYSGLYSKISLQICPFYWHFHFIFIKPFF